MARNTVVKMGKTTIMVKLDTDLEAPITTHSNVDVVGADSVALSQERYDKVKEIIEEQRAKDRQKSIYL